MKANDLTKLYTGHAVLNELLALITTDRPETRVCIEGLSGSSKPICTFSFTAGYTADPHSNNTRERRCCIFL